MRAELTGRFITQQFLRKIYLFTLCRHLISHPNPIRLMDSTIKPSVILSIEKNGLILFSQNLEDRRMMMSLILRFIQEYDFP